MIGNFQALGKKIEIPVGEVLKISEIAEAEVSCKTGQIPPALLPRGTSAFT